MVTTEIAGLGTPEAIWAPWLNHGDWRSLDIDMVRGSRVCVLAAHPDDEVLGVGGLLVELANRGHEIVMIWATDGEASHPGSTAMSPAELGELRREECHHAMARLGLGNVAMHFLELPDGELASCHTRLRARLEAVVDDRDLVISPWRGDGHPDHEAVAIASGGLGATSWQYPVWMWHWASPGETGVPWHRLQTVPVADVDRKAAAIAMFASQVKPIGVAPQDAAILPPHVVARFLRPVEWIFT